MSQIKKEDIKQEIFDLYDDYAHSRIDRRTFMHTLSAYAVGGLTVTSIMGFLMPDYQSRYRLVKTIQGSNPNSSVMNHRKAEER